MLPIKWKINSLFSCHVFTRIYFQEGNGQLNLNLATAISFFSICCCNQVKFQIKYPIELEIKLLTSTVISLYPWQSRTSILLLIVICSFFNSCSHFINRVGPYVRNGYTRLARIVNRFRMTIQNLVDLDFLTNFFYVI